MLPLKSYEPPYCKSLAFSRPGDEKKQSIMRHKISSREKKRKAGKATSIKILTVYILG